VVVQIALAKLGVGLMLQNHVFLGMACMMLAIKTPRFLSDLLISTGGGCGNAFAGEVERLGIKPTQRGQR
jgi:hypothetical protein